MVREQVLVRFDQIGYYLHNNGADAAAEVDKDVVLVPVEMFDNFFHLFEVRFAVCFAGERLIFIQ